MSRRRPQKPPRDSQADQGAAGAERLQKVLAAAGVGSRRDCEELIQQGRVEVDHQVVTELGTKVDPLRQEIRVDGTVLRQPKRAYYVLNKPVGVVSTNFDPSGRARIIDLLPNDERLFPVGRLDRSSEGLIVATNDGAFANRLTHPRYGVEKTYHVRVAGNPSEKELLRLRKGVHLSDGLAKVVSLRVKGRHKQSTDLEIILNEGKNREIRRILARVGHKVLSLKRTAVGTLKLGELPTGAWRKLSPQEVDELMNLAKRKRKEQKRGPASGPRPAVASAASPGSAGAPTRKPLAGVRPDKRSATPPAKAVHGKRPPSPYKPAQLAMSPPPADELLRLEDFLPPLPDDEGDGLDRPSGGMPVSKPGRVLGYEGDQPPQRPRPIEKPRTAKPAGRGFSKDRRDRRGNEPQTPGEDRRPARGKKFGKPAGKFGRKPAGRGGDAHAQGGGRPGKRGKGKRR